MVEEQATTKYQGIQLKTSEVTFLSKIEQIIDEPIPAGSLGFYKTGFISTNHHVIGLSLYNKNLEAIPDSIKALTCLERLFLRDNQPTTLPQAIGELSNLKNHSLKRKLKSDLFDS